MPDNILRTFRPDRLRGGGRGYPDADLQRPLHRIRDRQWPDRHDPRDIGIYLRFGGLRARSGRTIKDFPNPWLCRTHYRLCYGLLCPRLCRARPRCRDRSSGAGGDRPLFEYRINVCHLIRINLVFHSEFFHQYPERPTLAGRWHDRLFQLCHADIDRLWRCHTASSHRPYAVQYGGDHRSVVSGDPARSPDHPGAPRVSTALLEKGTQLDNDLYRRQYAIIHASGWAPIIDHVRCPAAIEALAPNTSVDRLGCKRL